MKRIRLRELKGQACGVEERKSLTPCQSGEQAVHTRGAVLPGARGWPLVWREGSGPEKGGLGSLL